MSGHMLTATLPRRASRSSGSQPACRSARVEKPRSHQNSPRTMERRKTTTESKLYATLDDHYRMMFGVEPEEEVEEQPTRPVSWHPSSNQFRTPQTSYFEPQQDWSQQYTTSPRQSARGSDFYSLSTRNSTYEPLLTQSTTPGYLGHRGSDESDYNWQSVQQTPSYVHSAINTPTTEPLPWYLQQWAQKNQAQQAMMEQHNGSSDFLPIQHPTTQDQEMEDDDGEKLVALGLYDMPESSQSWTGFAEATGKGLKLEETWQPPEEEEEDEEDADDASSEASVEEPSPPLPAVDEQTQRLQLPVHVKAHTPGSLEGQSFFFDDDEAVNKEWWYQQLKQPSMPIRDNSLGYDWL